MDYLREGSIVLLQFKGIKSILRVSRIEGEKIFHDKYITFSNNKWRQVIGLPHTLKDRICRLVDTDEFELFMDTSV